MKLGYIVAQLVLGLEYQSEMLIETVGQTSMLQMTFLKKTICILIAEMEHSKNQ